MRIAIIGQQDFGKAVLNAFLDRGDEVAAVFCAPEKPGARPDALRVGAEEKGVTAHQFPNYTSAEAQDVLRALKVDIGIMAYVLLFAPQAFVDIPKHGTIQFHPSLLPLHRGPSSINWPIMLGRQKTGLTIFRPNDGLDEGAVVLQKEVEIGPDDTLGSVYFDKIFPAGVAALLEAADQVVAGTATEFAQDEANATYEGWVREAESRLNWANHIDITYNIIRGCNPAPGAWTTVNGEKLQIFDAKKITARIFSAVRGKKLGQVVEVGAKSMTVHGAGGFIEVLRCKRGDGKKVAGNEAGIAVGTILGT
jgi:methionyl-tRNA formyltransferase